ncbi:MAG: hypothetical protein GC185_05950 [Alphaproteobacteria bacterium]|nr:hypothetical protein [Alphaproteobacteria bacterium]
MSKDINELALPLQKVIDMGEIDRWLRGISRIVPQPASHETAREETTEGMSVLMQNFNRHSMSYSTQGLIDDSDVEKMVGFRQLINASSKNNVRVDITSLGEGSLEVSFEPDEPFSRSRVFGASYTNVIPSLFGGTNGATLKK